MGVHDLAVGGADPYEIAQFTYIPENDQHASESLKPVLCFWGGVEEKLLILLVFSDHWFMIWLLPFMVVLVKVLLAATWFVQNL